MILRGIGVKEAFQNAKPGAVFAIGNAPDSPEGLNMTGSGKTLFWVAVKGYVDGWRLYCSFESREYYTKEHGYKVMDFDNVLRVLAADDGMLKHYRY